uniref:F-box domain-containing protein n=1 Tax=Anopheles dirus TaxID=7168 RepID=A0A182NXI8_9DIPT
MSDDENENHTAQLPFEVLCKIFDNLDVSSVKNCSRACRRWSEVIFSDYYIKRFKLRISVPQPFGLLQSENVLSPGVALTRSDRFYRHLELELNQLRDDRSKKIVFDIMYNILRYPKVEQLVSIKLTISLPDEIVRWLTDGIKTMKMLRELNIVRRTTNSQDHKLTIQSNSLQQLVLNNIIPRAIVTPKLSSLVVHRHSSELYTHRFANLKKLTLNRSSTHNSTDNNAVEKQIIFYHRLNTLETLTLNGSSVPGYLFKTICEQCRTLTELSIDSMCFYDNHTMEALSNLCNLRHLTFKKITAVTPVSFQSIALPKLESIGLGSFRTIRTDTLKAFSSATKLILHGVHNSEDLIIAIATYMPKLREVNYTADSVMVLSYVHFFNEQCIFDVDPRGPNFIS